MKRSISGFILAIIILISITSCSIFRPKATLIVWPRDITSMKAIGEINISWKDMHYSGDMSLALRYPDKLLLEVYSPFGNTAVSLSKDGDRFVMKAGSDEVRDEQRLVEAFNMTSSDIMEDLTMRGEMKQDHNGVSYIDRRDYKVTYHLGDAGNEMCWLNRDGRICITFFEAAFSEE